MPQELLQTEGRKGSTIPVWDLQSLQKEVTLLEQRGSLDVPGLGTKSSSSHPLRIKAKRLNLTL